MGGPSFTWADSSFVPSKIAGYARLAFAFYGFAVASTHPGYMMACYALSFVCDELDGRFARMLGQTSTLGQVLDMVTDRVATSCLLATLCVLYPRWQVLFLALLSLDIFSHWFQMFSTGARGNTTHKVIVERGEAVGGVCWVEGWCAGVDCLVAVELSCVLSSKRRMRL